MIKKYQKKPEYVEAMLITENLHNWLQDAGRNKAVSMNSNPSEFIPVVSFRLKYIKKEMPDIEMKYNYMTDRVYLKHNGDMIFIGDYIVLAGTIPIRMNPDLFEHMYDPVPPPAVPEPIYIAPEE